MIDKQISWFMGNEVEFCWSVFFGVGGWGGKNLQGDGDFYIYNLHLQVEEEGYFWNMKLGPSLVFLQIKTVPGRKALEDDFPLLVGGKMNVSCEGYVTNIGKSTLLNIWRPQLTLGDPPKEGTQGKWSIATNKGLPPMKQRGLKKLGLPQVLIIKRLKIAQINR